MLFEAEAEIGAKKCLYVMRDLQWWRCTGRDQRMEGVVGVEVGMKEHR